MDVILAVCCHQGRPRGVLKEGEALRLSDSYHASHCWPAVSGLLNSSDTYCVEGCPTIRIGSSTLLDESYSESGDLDPDFAADSTFRPEELGPAVAPEPARCLR